MNKKSRIPIKNKVSNDVTDSFPAIVGVGGAEN